MGAKVDNSPFSTYSFAEGKNSHLKAYFQVAIITAIITMATIKSTTLPICRLALVFFVSSIVINPFACTTNIEKF
jgi:hypothetical protein